MNPPALLASTQTWWFVSRSSGIVAWGLCALAILWGLALSTRALGRKPPAPWLLDLHRFLGALAVVFTGVHLAGLVLDNYVHFGAADLFVPFAASWKPSAVAWGVVAFYLLVAVELTSLVRNRLPKRLWKGIHFTSYLLYVFATVHLFEAGTDSMNPYLRWTVWASIGAVAFFTVYRVVGPGRAASVRSGGGREAGRGRPTRPVAAASEGAPSPTPGTTERRDRIPRRSPVRSS